MERWVSPSPLPPSARLTDRCLSVRQEELRTGERAVVRFRFIKHPEYLRLGAKLLFREGVTKGIGHVTRLLPRPAPANSPCHQDQNADQNQNLQGHPGCGLTLLPA